MCPRCSAAAAVDSLSVDSPIVLPPCLPPAQALWSVEASAVGEARSGPLVGHPKVTAIEPDESLYGLFDLSTGSVETASECDNSDPTAEVLRVNGPHSPPGFPRTDGADGGGDPAQVHEEYQPEPLTSLQREELRRRNMDALHTPIVGETPEARALEDVRLANLAECTRLENLQRALDERARQRVPDSSRRQLFPPPTQVYRTLVQNLAASARIAESIQPSQSEAGRGLM